MYEHLRSVESVHLQNSWLTIGSFDGVHLGHQSIIRGLTSGAQSYQAPTVVLTFHPHPAVILRGRQDPYYLTTPEERAELLGMMGINIIISHPFNQQVADTSAYEFISMLYQHLKFTHLWVGYDFALGKNREGDINELRNFGEEFNFHVEEVSQIYDSEEIISSSRIRHALSEGEVNLTQKLLGRPYSIQGTVIHGDGRGKSIGVPTANLKVNPHKIVPSMGVYACLVTIRGQKYPAATNVGVRPTFDGKIINPQIEAHILDFDKGLYGEEIKLEFINRLRGEKRFNGIPELVTQIQEDITRTRKILSLITIESE
jgi:riboflavin kinase/FMN adenylyltransferase